MEFLSRASSGFAWPIRTASGSLLDEDFVDSLGLEKYDMVFLFKALDSLEIVQRHVSKSFVSKLPVPYLVVSFATRSLGKGSKMAVKRGSWFLNLCDRMGWSYDTFEVEGEFFVLVDKSLST